MSISAAVDGVIDILLPQECLLCAAPGGNALLCPDCRADLPRLPVPGCPHCALPGPDGIACGRCLKSPPAYDATVAVWVYAFPVDKLVQTLKYSHRLALADFFAAAMLAGPRPAGDLVIPLPLAPRRLAERGFNQAVEISRPLARALGLPLTVDACRRVFDTVPQASLPWKERRRNVKGVFACDIDLTGKNIIVVDDVMTTGSTLDEFARSLKRRGAARVVNWVAARALKDDRGD